MARAQGILWRGSGEVIEPKDLNQKCEALSGLLKEKIGPRGATLEKQVKSTGRRLPKRLHQEADVILEARKKAPHPKLAATVDSQRVGTAFTRLTDHLEAIDPKDRRKGKLLGWLGYQVFNLILIATALILLLLWRGYLG